MTCLNCGKPIKGGIKIGNIVSKQEYKTPKFCDNCGTPYPWTSAAQEATRELIELSELSAADQEQFKNSIQDLLHDGPKTSVAVVKFKSFALRAGKEIATGLKDVLVDIVSETAKKAIWG